MGNYWAYSGYSTYDALRGVNCVGTEDSILDCPVDSSASCDGYSVYSASVICPGISMCIFIVCTDWW